VDQSLSFGIDFVQSEGDRNGGVLLARAKGTHKKCVDKRTRLK
jgi:hypothetical protein